MRAAGVCARDQRMCIICSCCAQIPVHSPPARQTLTGQRWREPGGAGRGLSPSRPARPRRSWVPRLRRPCFPAAGSGCGVGSQEVGCALKDVGRGRCWREAGLAPHWPGQDGPERDPPPSNEGVIWPRGAWSSLHHLRTLRAGETMSRPAWSHEPGTPGGSATCLPYDPGQVPVFHIKSKLI